MKEKSVNQYVKLTQLENNYDYLIQASNKIIFSKIFLIHSDNYFILKSLSN